MKSKINRKRMQKLMAMGMILLGLSGLFTGCKKSDTAEETVQNTQAEQQTALAESADGTETAEDTENTDSTGQDAAQEETELPAESDGTDTPLLPNATGWAVQKYTDEYLSYEIPESWEKNEDESSQMMLFAFFQSKSPEAKYPSNVNVQITQLDTGNQPMHIDYGAEDIQEEFHQFMLNDMGLPAEAANGTFSVTQTGKGVYVYSLGFERKAMDNTTVHQTIYLPMDMQHSIVIWATDFRDGAKVSADEAALHLCETLEIVK